jgi:acyl-CoA synthetase (AMP-forming)/AMP-acid ligase II
VNLPEQYRPLTVAGGIHLAARRTPDKVAVLEGSRSMVFAKLSARIGRVARALLDLGLERGSRVAVLAPNCLEYPELVCGIADAGLIAVTLNPRAHAREMSDVLVDSGARVLLLHPSFASHDRELVAPALERRIVIGDDYERWLAAAPSALPLPTLTEFDPFVLVYTSGTTGRAKGLLLPHRARSLLFFAKSLEYRCYGPDDKFLGIASMALGAGFGFAMCALYFGGSLEILPGFDAATVLRKLSEERFTGVFVVPSHLQAILSLPASELDRYRGRATSLKALISNAAALPYSLKEQVVDYFGAGLLHETYGFTEAGVVTDLCPADQLRKPGSVGRAFPMVDVQLLDEQGQPVKRGEVGEIFVSSPWLFNGYWRQPAETAACTRHGYVSAGDLARQDEDGCYYIVDRKKDMVVSGGLNIYPREIEEALFLHPGVADAAVIGVPDQKWGERLLGFIVARTGQDTSAAQLEAHCRTLLATYKVPRNFRFVDELPRNISGKVLKRVLRERANES